MHVNRELATHLKSTGKAPGFVTLSQSELTNPLFTYILNVMNMEYWAKIAVRCHRQNSK